MFIESMYNNIYSSFSYWNNLDVYLLESGLINWGMFK